MGSSTRNRRSGNHCNHLSVTAVDRLLRKIRLLSQDRDGEVVTLSKSIGYNALPGDLLSFSLPAQNRGVLTSPSTEMEIVVPDGSSIRQAVPSIEPYSEQRIIVNWTVPEGTTIGNKTLTFTVDPDELITGDANRSNNQAQVEIFMGVLQTHPSQLVLVTLRLRTSLSMPAHRSILTVAMLNAGLKLNLDRVWSTSLRHLIVPCTGIGQIMGTGNYAQS